MMDVKAMDFPEASFETVIDKATLDSVLVHVYLCSVAKIQQLIPIKWSLRFTEYSAKMVSI